MSKILRNIARQEADEGNTEDLQQVKKIYDLLIKKTGHIWNSQWSVLVNTKFVGKYPNSHRYYYTTFLGKQLSTTKD